MIKYMVEFFKRDLLLRRIVLMNGEEFTAKEALDVILWQHNNGKAVMVYLQQHRQLEDFREELEAYNVPMVLVVLK